MPKLEVAHFWGCCLGAAALVSMPAPVLARETIAEASRCFSSGGAKPVHLELRLFLDPETNWKGGYVRYGASKKVVPIVPLTVATSEPQDGRPAESNETWGEVAGGKIAGEYRFTYQGTNFYEFSYRNYKNGKLFTFAQDNEAWSEKGCRWR